MFQVTKDTIISEILMNAPETMPLFQQIGMHCMGCALSSGESVEEADAADFAAGRLRHPYTKALWRALPQNGFTPIPGAQPYPGEIPEGCQFAPRCPRRRPECTAGPVPFLPFRGGMVRCRIPEGGSV